MYQTYTGNRHEKRYFRPNNESEGCGQIDPQINQNMNNKPA